MCVLGMEPRSLQEQSVLLTPSHFHPQLIVFLNINQQSHYQEAGMACSVAVSNRSMSGPFRTSVCPGDCGFPIYLRKNSHSHPQILPRHDVFSATRGRVGCEQEVGSDTSGICSDDSQLSQLDGKNKRAAVFVSKSVQNQPAVPFSHWEVRLLRLRAGSLL